MPDQPEPLGAGACHGNRVPFALEEIAQEEGRVGVMVDDQDGILLAHLSEPITTRQGACRSGTGRTRATRAARRRRSRARDRVRLAGARDTGRWRPVNRSRRTLPTDTW